jgi:hypothetical protein
MTGFLNLISEALTKEKEKIIFPCENELGVLTFSNYIYIFEINEKKNKLKYTFRTGLTI